MRLELGDPAASPGYRRSEGYSSTSVPADRATTVLFVPSVDVPPGVRPVTLSEIEQGLSAIGVRPGGVLMVHTRMSEIGWVVGGADVVVTALLDALGTNGTLMAYVGWSENPWHLEAWPETWQRAYLEELPPFDPSIAEADRDVGRIPERIRTWPSAKRSSHPEANVVAVGARAEWIVDPHPWDFPQEPDSPLARLVESNGQVLMLRAARHDHAPAPR